MRIKAKLREPQISKQQGFSLIELMIALVVGLVVAGGAISLSVSHLQNNSLVVTSARLTQEARAMTAIINREVRRARMYGQSVRRVGSPTTLNPFDLISSPDPTCIQYAYDVDMDGVADSGEFRSISVNAGGQLLLGRFDTAADVRCGVGTVLNSPEVQVSSLNFTVVNNLVQVQMQTRLAANAAITRFGYLSIRLRTTV